MSEKKDEFLPVHRLLLSKRPPTKRMAMKHLRILKRTIFIILTLTLTIYANSNALVVKANVSSVHGIMIGLDIGSEKGIRPGDVGRVYYTVTVGGEEKAVYIAKFKVTQLAPKSAMARIQEKTGEVRIGFLADVEVSVGGLEVKSDPSGAKTYLDGKDIGITPNIHRNIPPGRYLLKIVKEGFKDHVETVEVISGEQRIVTASLEKEVREGNLVVLTEPAGAMVYINGKFAGASPYESGNLRSGPYKVRIIMKGYDVWERGVTIEAGKKIEVLAQLRVKEGELKVESEPSGARVYLDGKEMGETPLILPGIRLGQHSIRVIKEGYYPYDDQVEIDALDRKTFVAPLKNITGDLVVRSEPLRAVVYIDGKEVGVSPYEATGLSPGFHKVRVAKKGFENWEKDVAVEAGKNIQVLAKLEATRKCDAPLWRAGDYWAYGTSLGKKFDVRVLGTRKDGFLIRSGRFYRIFDKTFYNKFKIEGAKEVESDFLFKGALNFPFVIGKKWKDKVKHTGEDPSMWNTELVEYHVEGLEDVTTPAGTFKAFIINAKIFRLGSGNRTWARLWYSPEVEAFIKREVEKTGYLAFIEDLYLVEYELDGR